MSVHAAAATRPRRLRGAVDLRASISIVGALVKYLAAAFAVPTGVAIGYGEPFWPFVAAAAITAALGLALERVGAPEHVGVREGFLVVALTWLVVAVVGALPYLLSGNDQLDRPIDALFESMSGFTTTGSSVLVDIEAMPRSLLIWRALTQWLGGMGIIVLALAVLPRLRVGGRQLLEQEMPGPEVEPFGARVRQTAQRLWLLYVGITATEVLALAVLGLTVDERMDLFRAVAHAFTTLPSGGFGTEGRSIEPFSAATQWTIAIFMIVAGTNFALTYRALLRRRPGVFPRDEEFRLYVALLGLAATVLAIEIWAEGIQTGEAAIRNGVFQAATMMTSTGYASTDFNLWTTLALMLLVGLLLIGGSAGSTSGSIKVLRHLLLGKVLRRELTQTVHPELVIPIRLNGVVVDERTLRAVSSFILLYVGFFVVGAVLIAVDAARAGLDVAPLDAVAASATTLANTGPGLGFAGPMGSFEPFTDFSSLVMIVLMWAGRLEIIPVVVLLLRHYWRN